MGGRGSASTSGSSGVGAASAYIRAQAGKLGRSDGPSTEAQRGLLKSLQSENEFKRGWGESAHSDTYLAHGMSASEAHQYAVQQQHVLSVNPEKLSKNQASVAIGILQRKDLGITRTTTAAQRAANTEKWATRKKNAEISKRLNSRIDSLNSKLASASSESQREALKTQIASFQQKLKKYK